MTSALDQVVDLLVGRLAVVAGDAVVDAVGQSGRGQFVHPPLDGVGHPDRVGALLLGHGDVDRRKQRPAGGLPGAAVDRRDGCPRGAARVLGRRAEADPGVALHLGRAVEHVGHVLQIDGPVAGDVDDQVLQLLGVADERAGVDDELAVLLLEVAGAKRARSLARSASATSQGRGLPRGQPLGVEFDADRPRPAADDRHAVRVWRSPATRSGAPRPAGAAA